MAARFLNVKVQREIRSWEKLDVRGFQRVLQALQPGKKWTSKQLNYYVLKSGSKSGGRICELLKSEAVPVRGVLGKLAGGLWKLNTQQKPSRGIRLRGAALAKMAGVTGEEVKRMVPDLTDAGKRSLMLDCLRSKYAKEPYRSLLLSTGTATLHEAVQRGKPNSWTYPGGDWLGQLLMRVRGELRSPSPKRSRVRLKGKRCPAGSPKKAKASRKRKGVPPKKATPPRTAAEKERDEYEAWQGGEWLKTKQGKDWENREKIRKAAKKSKKASPTGSRVRLKGKRCPPGFRRDPEDAAWCREKAVPRGGSRRRTVRELQRVLKSRGVSRCLSFPKRTLEYILAKPSRLRKDGKKVTCAAARAAAADAGSKKLKKSPPKKELTMKKAYEAKFYDIAEDVLPGYEDDGYVRVPGGKGRVAEAWYEKRDRDIEDCISDKKMRVGDVIFVGSTYETRQEYGFGVVLPREKTGGLTYAGGEYPVGIPLEYAAVLKQHKVHYKKLLEKMEDVVEDQRPRDQVYLFSLFIGGDWTDRETRMETYKKYEEAGIW